MKDRTVFRLRDIIDAIEQIDALLADKSFEDIQQDRVTRAAFERFLEILSEASRHVPQALKNEAPDIAWRRVADIGNHLRHTYHRVDAEILWNLHTEGELAHLRNVVLRFLTRMEK
ncbi:MAG: HepT-like ribonuclease domain-containing protein [Rhizobiaceae bacterium]